MPTKLAVVMDPITSINYKKDSTLAMLWAAQEKGWELFYLEQNDLYIDNGRAFCHRRPLRTYQNPEHWFDLGQSQTVPLADFDVILMRKDPPFDMEFIYTTYILDKAEQEGTLIVNHPQSLRDCNEKVFTTQFAQCCVPTLVSARAADLKGFVTHQQDAILKPLHGMGGASIFRTGASDPNLNVIIETLTEHGRTPAMAQRYIPEIIAGDKRILIVDGEPVPFCLARIPAEGETRGNLAAGGSGVVQPLTERDRWICEQIKPDLLQRGLMFVGIDVIGDYLTEVNVTSPTCIREIDAESGINAAELLMEAIDKRLNQ